MTANEKTREIGEINVKAFDMAQEVARDPSRREALAEEAAAMEERLLDLAEELDAKHPGVAHAISESVLDLGFVIRDSSVMSLRLGHFLQ